MTTQTLHLIDEYLTQGGYTPGIDAETLEREAHLVAAAPDLLAALTDAYQYMVDYKKCQNQGLLDDMKAAIDKAKGN